MPDYRLYFLDRSSARFERFVDFSASDDADAMAFAEGHEGHQSLELWTDGRKVCRIEGMGEVQDWASAAE